MEDSTSKKEKPKLENQKVMMKISSAKNVSGIGCVILLGGALITAAAMASAFLISRNLKKSTKNITKKKGNEKIENESSNKELHFLLPQQQQSSSNETDKLCENDSTTSLFSTPNLIQDGKPKLDEKGDTLNGIVSDHPKEERKSPSFERLQEELELSETKISLLPDPDPDQELDEVSRVRIEVIQGNEKTEVLSHVHQAQTTIFSNPALQMDNKREFLVHNDRGESNELQHNGVIETNNLEEGLIQEQEKQATGDQETSTSNEHEPLNSAFELMKADDEDENKDHLQCVYFEVQCADAETQIDQIAKICDERMQLSDEEECAKENDQANSKYSPCRTYSIDVQNLDAYAIRNASADDQHSAEVMDSTATGEQSPETEQLVEKQSFESDCQGNVLKENEVEEIVVVNEEAEEDDDDYDDKKDAAQEVEDDILEGARNSSTQSNSHEIWPADSNQELLLEHKEEIVKEVEEGTKIEEDELCSVENCNLKSTQNDVAITSRQQSYDGKDDSTVNVIDSYLTKLMYLDDIAAITRGRRVLLGVLLVLIWYFVLKGILPLVV